MIPFASEVILFVCHPPISEITQGATLADELYPHFYLKKNSQAQIHTLPKWQSLDSNPGPSDY